jgi:hypothetical protein
MNCWADIGVPSGCQNVVAIMCWIVRALPSASFTLIFGGRGGRGVPPPLPSPSSPPPVVLASSSSSSSPVVWSIGSPSHSGSLKCWWAFTKS